MEKIAILTDSNSGITQAEGKKLGITVIPMPFTIDGNEYLEDISITQAEFFEMLEKGADVKTSQPSEFTLEQTWMELLKTHESVLYIPMSSGLSGTCENAMKFAEKFGGKVLVVDNLKISVMQKLSVFEAIKMAEEGKSATEIKQYLEETRGKFSIYLTLSTLKFLKRGGRVTPAVATFGDLLGLKPILSSRGQSFDKFAVTMSFNQAKRKMIAKIKNELETEFKTEYEVGKMALLVAYSKSDEEAKKFKDEIERELPNMKVNIIDPLSLSIACHTGAGAVGIGICYYKYL